MSVKQAVSATAGLIFTIATLMGWWAYDAEQTRARLNHAYRIAADHERIANGLAKEAREHLDAIELNVLRLGDELDALVAETDPKNLDAMQTLIAGIRAQADNVPSTIRWLHFITDADGSGTAEVTHILGALDTARISVSKVQRLSDTWLFEGEALAATDVKVLVMRLAASPHLEQIDIVDIVKKTDKASQRSYTTYRLSADAVIRPELPITDREASNHP